MLLRELLHLGQISFKSKPVDPALSFPVPLMLRVLYQSAYGFLLRHFEYVSAYLLFRQAVLDQRLHPSHV